MSRDGIAITLGAVGLMAVASRLSGEPEGSSSRLFDSIRKKKASKPAVEPKPRPSRPRLRVAPPAPAPQVTAPRASSLEGVTVTFTGFRDRELGEQISRAGGYPSDRFTKATGLVVAKDPTRMTGKVKRAHTDGIEVVSIPQLRRRLRGARPQRSPVALVDLDEPRPAPTRQRRGDPIRGGVMDAKTWKGGDPTGKLASEKFMGVRGYWNGEGIYSKNGNRFPAPPWFTDLLPPGEDLDGELYIGPGRFEDTVSVIRSSGAMWREVRFMVFDAPQARGTYRERIKAAERAVQGACKRWARARHGVAIGVGLAGEGLPCPIVMVDNVEITSRAHLERLHREIVQRGGEGTMLRDPDSGYERFRSNRLWKHKDFKDAEGEVIGYKAGASGPVSAYRVRDLSNGAVFTVDARHGAAARGGAVIPVGTVVTFRFQERTSSGKPRHPVLVGPRDYE